MRRRRTRASMARSISFVVVLPTLPVTATSRAGEARARRRRRARAGPRSVSATRSSGAPAGRRAAVHHRAGRARRQRIGDERMPVAVLAPQRHEQIARRAACGVSIDTPVAAANPGALPAGRVGADPARSSSVRHAAPRQSPHDARHRRTAAPSSPTIWPCSWPLPATTSTSPGPSAFQRRRSIACRAVADLVRARAGGEHGGADRRRVLAARIVVGDDRDVGERARDRAHQRPLAAIAVAAGAEHHVQPPVVCGRSARQQPLQRVGRVRVVDIDRGAIRPAAPPVPSARARPSGAAAGRARRRCPVTLGERRGHQRVVGLEPARQRQLDTRCSPPACRRPAPGRRGRGVARSRRSDVAALADA